MPTIRIAFENTAGTPGQTVLAYYGPTLDVRIGFDPSFQPGAAPRSNLPEILYPALVDTGARDSCIDSALALELGLPATRQGVISGAFGAGQSNYYRARIYVPDLGFTLGDEFPGVHLGAGGQRHFALLGRTFLQNFTMIYEGRSGIMTISND